MKHLLLASLAVALLYGGCSSSSSAGDGGAPDTDTDTGAYFDPQCHGKDDFTLCESVTEPDLDYDICVGEWCRTPGKNANTPGPHFPLADTNQRQCFDDDSIYGAVDGGVTDGGSSCPSEGEDFFGQDAQYGWDISHGVTERFTRDTTTKPGEPTVVDNSTGLQWLGCVVGLSGENCTVGTPGEYTWREAVFLCDGLSWGGHDSWRLPDVYELSSIIDLALTDPSLDSLAFPGMPNDKLRSSYYYTGEGSSISACADLMTSELGTCYASDATHHVLCVGGGPIGTRRLDVSIFSGDRLVADTATGLEWQGCPAGRTGEECEVGETETLTWRDALSFCESLSWAGHDDWRLPNAKELLSIEGRYNYYVGGTGGAIFPYTWSSSSFWSSSSDQNDPIRAMRIIVSGTPSMRGAAKENSRGVRCVRE